MDNSVGMKRMLEAAMKAHPNSFPHFDTTKNVQDQLQEILGVRLPANGLYAIGKWCEKKGWLEYYRDFKNNLITSCPYGSMEQLWLAFCMSEKFNEIWDGDEWVPIEA